MMRKKNNNKKGKESKKKNCFSTETQIVTFNHV